MVHFSGSDIVLFVIGFFLPPLAGTQRYHLGAEQEFRALDSLLFKQGCGCDFLISIGLTLLGHVPGVAYAWWVIYANREDPFAPHHHGAYRRPLQAQANSGRRSYVAVASQPLPDGAMPAPGVIHHYRGQAQPLQQPTSHAYHVAATTEDGSAQAIQTKQHVVPRPLDNKDVPPPPY
ncbi:hypothetical protein EDD11_007844 [Mortierella claussenii]|nr:hypothetical protein EDD11_007844 [Mortierella claussenii]